MNNQLTEQEATEGRRLVFTVNVYDSDVPGDFRVVENMPSPEKDYKDAEGIALAIIGATMDHLFGRLGRLERVQ